MKLKVQEGNPGYRNSKILRKYSEIQKQFVTKQNDRFWDYLLGRGLTKEAIEKFELGYNNEFFDINKGEPLIAKDSITIPFRDMYGRIVAFQSRFINGPMVEGKQLRYFFTNNLPYVYQKIKYIYNLDRVITNHHNRVAVIVEGVFDLISLDIAGIHNVVSPLQNRLSIEAVEILYRYFDKIYFLMDKGDAGETVALTKNKRLYELDLYKIQVKNVDGIELKDANDMLKAEIDIRKFMKENKQEIIV